jgi:tetratricopeptide (TPR) repeat protein
MATSEIDKLERRYAENPQGLTFAPLAEVHRKNGDHTRALELLRPGLELHPNYIPASIVLGRCHLDLADLPAAESAFAHVLSLDGENVIALKALADISERLMRFDDAERWLQQLLAVDRSNDEAREQLERVESSRRQAETASSADPDALHGPAAHAEPASALDAPAVVPLEEPVPAAAMVTAEREAGMERAAEQEPVESQVAELDVVSEEARVPWVSDPGAPDEAEPVALQLEALETSLPAEAAPESRPEGIQLEEPDAAAEPVEPLEGLVGRDDVALEEDFQVETSDDIVLRSRGSWEYQMPNAAEELAANPVQAPQPALPMPFEEDAPLPPAHAEPEAVMPHAEPEAVVPQAEPEPVVSQVEPEPVASQAEPEPVVTPPVTEPVAEPVTEPPARRAFAARETGGQTVAEFFRGLLAARPPAPPPVHPAGPPSAAHVQGQEAGAPTRPAADALSLSSVFGEEAPPSPPAVPAAETAAPGVSFDQFFGQPGSGSPRAPRASDSKSDDLDQFHAWLQNLKR